MLLVALYVRVHSWCHVLEGMVPPSVVSSLGLPGTEAPPALEEHVRRIADVMVGYLHAQRQVGCSLFRPVLCVCCYVPVYVCLCHCLCHCVCHCVSLYVSLLQVALSHLSQNIDNPDRVHVFISRGLSGE